MKLFATTFAEAWPFSKLLFSWMDSFVFRARFSRVSVSELALGKNEESERVSKQFEGAWNEQLKKKNPSLLIALVKCFIVDFLIAGR
jgi:hypothetical protein